MADQPKDAKYGDHPDELDHRELELLPQEQVAAGVVAFGRLIFFYTFVVDGTSKIAEKLSFGNKLMCFEWFSWKIVSWVFWVIFLKEQKTAVFRFYENFGMSFLIFLIIFFMIFGKMSKNKPAFEDDVFHPEGQYQQEDNRPTGLLLEQGFESRL